MTIFVQRVFALLLAASQLVVAFIREPAAEKIKLALPSRSRHRPLSPREVDAASGQNHRRFAIQPHGGLPAARGSAPRVIEMNRMLISVLLTLCISIPVAALGDTVRTVVPRATLNYLSVPVAEAKGFFRDQGLENETIVIPGSTAIAALVSGNVNYSGAGGTGMRAALRGAPIKAVMFQTERVTWYLLAAPDIQRIADLKGKRVAVGTVGDTQDSLISMLVEREGLRGRDITRVAMPSRTTTTTILSLKTGAFSAAVVNADESLLGEKEGLRTLAFVGDLFPFPFQGFMATDKMIAEKPNEIKKWLRAMARALIFIREQPEAAADIALKKLPMGSMSRPLAVEGIRRFAKALPDGVPGLPSAQGIKNVIEFDVKAPLKIKEDVPAEKVMNLRLMREVKDELETKR